MRLIIKGLQRTCTNFAEELVRQNFGIAPEVRHKHDLKPVGPRGAPVILCLKNPYAWLVSIYRHARRTPSYREPGTFSQFLRRKFGFPLAKGGFETARFPVHFWNEKNEKWLAYRGRKIIRLYMESFLTHNNAVAAINRLIEGAGLERPGKLVIPSNARLSRGFDRAHYAKRRYLKLYSQKDLRFVSNQLDPSLVKELGYRCESPS